MFRWAITGHVQLLGTNFWKYIFGGQFLMTGLAGQRSATAAGAEHHLYDFAGSFASTP